MVDISDSEASCEDTDDESYNATHEIKEQTEALLRFRPELRRIKANGRSTQNLHCAERTQENFEANLNLLRLFLGNGVVEEYRSENLHVMQYPTSERLEDALVVLRTSN